MEGRVHIHLNQPELHIGRKGSGYDHAALAHAGTARDTAHIQLSIQHEVKSKKVKIAQFVGQFVTDTLEACGHNCLHATLCKVGG